MEGGFSGNHSSGGDLPSSDNGGGHGGRGGRDGGWGRDCFFWQRCLLPWLHSNTVKRKNIWYWTAGNEIGMDEADVDKVFGKQHWPGRAVTRMTQKGKRRCRSVGKENLPEESCILAKRSGDG